MKKNGFTLIELLSAVTILGIIMAVSVQTYFMLRRDNKQKKTDYYVQIIEKSADLFFEVKKHGMEDGDCYSVKYETLVQRNFLKEEDITCSGSLLIRKNKRAYQYDNSLLSCKLKKNNEVVKTATGTMDASCRSLD